MFMVGDRVTRIEARDVVWATVIAVDGDNVELAYDEGGTGWWPSDCLAPEPPLARPACAIWSRPLPSRFAAWPRAAAISSLARPILIWPRPRPSSWPAGRSAPCPWPCA